MACDFNWSLFEQSFNNIPGIMEKISKFSECMCAGIRQGPLKFWVSLWTKRGKNTLKREY